MNKRTKVILVILSVVFISGCAFGTRRPVLEYTSIIPIRNPNNISIKVAAFKDNRPDKDIVGNVRNGFGMKTADVVTETNISEWVTTALKSELKNAGYTVTEDNAKNQMQGEIIRVYCDAFMTYEGEVMLKVTLRKNNDIILDQNYSGKASEVNIAATAKSYGITLQRALQQVMIQVVNDVDRALKEE